ncbi:MAG: cupin domain-containing protein [Actinomycetota bacterium]|nr:cupin domain-containing protein [Actinomycetota bacterium]
MAFVVRAADRLPAGSADGVTREWVLGPGRVPDGRVTVEVIRLEPGSTLDLVTAPSELAWLQVLSGAVLADGEPTGNDWICMAAGGRGFVVTAPIDAEVVVARVPRAAEYDPAIAAGAAVRVDWGTEPVLESEHDTRRRIYLASPGLWGTEAVKGEMIIYPPGATGAAHHHEGAEHFQFVMSGSGTAVLEGGEVELEAGDLLYNLEKEVHWFANRTDEDMVFVEFFVPGHNRTVWVPGANACGWNPTGIDIHGRAASRQLAYHVHGEGDV